MNDVPPSRKRPKSLFRALLIWGVLFGGLFMVFPGIIFLPFITTIYRADEGFRRAQRTINPEELRKWAFQEIKERGGSENHDIPRSDFPDYVQKLYAGGPESASALADGDQSRVVIFWGGGFFHWVMEIGDTNYSKPFDSENQEYPHNYQWTNGIYYSHEAHWPLL